MSNTDARYKMTTVMSDQFRFFFKLLKYAHESFAIFINVNHVKPWCSLKSEESIGFSWPGMVGGLKLRPGFNPGSLQKQVIFIKSPFL